MRSPFPGMDPYLERHWGDVHTSLIASAREALNRVLPSDLIASVEERVAVETDEGQERSFNPEVQVLELPAGEAVAATAPSPGAAIAPYCLSAVVEPITERFIRIVEAGTERLITVIEFVSPTNKRGDGLVAFRGKRADLLTLGVNFVEVDLVRAGNWRRLLQPFHCPRKAIAPYRVTFRISREPGFAWLYPVSFRDRLPSIVIPLRPDDPRVLLDLQELLDQTYASGRYARRMGYAEPLDPPLEGEEAAWTEELLRAAGKR
jgi:hypothetical protein